MMEISLRRMRQNQLALLLPRRLGPLDQERLHWICENGRWLHLKPGEQLMQQGQPSDALYLVVSGRLQAVVASNGDPRVVAEYPRGDTVGEVDLITGESRMASVYALRECELFEIPKQAFDAFLVENPHVLKSLTRDAVARAWSVSRPTGLQRGVRSVAIVPVHEDVPAEEFAQRLARTLGQRTFVLTPSRLEARYGVPGAARIDTDHPGYIRLASWLDEQEDRFDHLIFVAQPGMSPWTRQSLQRADHICVCAWADTDSGHVADVFRGERSLTAELPKSLILLHRDHIGKPTGTAAWLEGIEVKYHMHVRWQKPDDIARVARFLSGRAVGLTLSGGGARGLAHIGVIQAFQELGIPIDVVGGTSMGACIAAMVALEFDIETMKRHTWETFVTPRPFKQFTLPIFSLLRDRLFDTSAQRVFGTSNIEDCWIQTFAVISNLTTAEMMVAERGALVDAVLATMALPGIVTPRIARGALLADGGIINNLPVDVMRERAHRVVAVDVGSGGEGPKIDFDTFPSSWGTVLRRISPFHKSVEVPSILDIMLRSSLLSSAERVRAAKAASDIYLTPPVGDYGFMDMERQEEIIRRAYHYALEALSAVRSQLVDFEVAH